MQLCSKPRGPRGIEPESFRRFIFFILSSDHWTKRAEWDNAMSCAYVCMYV